MPRHAPMGHAGMGDCKSVGLLICPWKRESIVAIKLTAVFINISPLQKFPDEDFAVDRADEGAEKHVRAGYLAVRCCLSEWHSSNPEILQAVKLSPR
eukprot:6196142-Pleurochrysis_carterae.AAC.1